MLFADLLKTSALILGAIFGLFVLLDYAIHFRELITNAKVSFSIVFFYYLCHLSKYLAILLPLSLLIASIKVLTTMNEKRELLALLAGGLSKKRLILPFLITAGCISLLLLANFEFFTPRALAIIDAFDMKTLKRSSHKEPRLYTVPLEDGSNLYYSKRSLKEMALFDVYWIESLDSIWRIKSLKLLSNGPEAYFVDHLTRDLDNNLVLQSSNEFLPMPQMRIETLARTNFFIPFQARPISELIALKNSSLRYHVQSKSVIKTQLYHKLLTPLIALTAVLIVVRTCMRYKRDSNSLKIYALSFFGFMMLSALINATTIIGEADLIDPIIALLIPTALPVIYFGGRLIWL